MRREYRSPDITYDFSPESLKNGGATLRRVFQTALRYYRPICLLLALGGLGCAIGLVNPLLYKEIINSGVLKGDAQLVIKLALVAAGISIVEAFLLYHHSTMVSRIGVRIAVELGSDVFSCIKKMPIGFFARAKTGTIVHRLHEDINRISDSFVSILSTLVTSLITVSLALSAMFLLSWKLTLASLILVPAFVVSARVIGYRLRILARERARRTGEKNSYVVEMFNVGGALVSKVFGCPEADLYSFEQMERRLGGTKIHIAKLSAFLTVGLGLIASLAITFLYGWGGSMAANGLVDVGTLVALVAYLVKLYSPLTTLGNLQVKAISMLVSFERVFEIFDMKPLVVEKAGAISIQDGPVSLEFDTVKFRYPAPAEISRASFEKDPVLSNEPEKTVLHEISFKVEPGEMYALVGLSGSGKTTIAQLALRLYDPNSGAVRIGGCDLRDVTMESIRAKVGIVTQDSHFFHGTIRANLLYVKPDAHDEELLEVLENAQILNVIEGLPDGMDTVIGERGHRLSGGEKQRLAIARVLLKSPDLVILDEATAHLDSASEQAVQRSFEAALAGRTSLVIAHRLSTVRHADCIIVLDRGSVIERGNHEELIRKEGAYSRLYNTQFGGFGEKAV